LISNGLHYYYVHLSVKRSLFCFRNSLSHDLLRTFNEWQTSNRPYSYSRYWTGTSLQWRLMLNEIKVICIWKDVLHKPQLQASLSPLMRIQIWPIVIHFAKTVSILIQNFSFYPQFSLVCSTLYICRERIKESCDQLRFLLPSVAGKKSDMASVSYENWEIHT